MVYPGFLKQAAKTIGGSFFVLPFSVHEIILVDDKVGNKYVESLKRNRKRLNGSNCVVAEYVDAQGGTP